jgi:hypothetical protein
MTPQEILALCHDLNLEVRAEAGNLIVSPADKLPATLRDQLRDHKEALLEVLQPQSFANPRAKLRQLEKALNFSGPEPQEQWIIIQWREHAHTEQEIDTMERRVLAAAVAQFRASGDDSGFYQLLQIGLRGCCVVCRELGVAALPLQEVPP